MPFYSHGRSSSQQNAQQAPFSTTSGIFQAAQTLGSIGAPVNSLRASSGTDARLSPTTGAPLSSIGRHSRSVSSYSSFPSPLAAHILPSQKINAVSADTRNDIAAHSQHSNKPVRPQEVVREDQRNSSTTTPRIQLDQQESDIRQSYSADQSRTASQPGGPGSRQSSLSNIPLVASDMASDPYGGPLRSAAQSHNYSRSSPGAGASNSDSQSFPTYSNSMGPSDAGQYASSSTQKYMPQGQQRNVSNTPLGLADIRPRADSSVEAVPGANPYSYDGANSQPTNSNYLAPWAIYAFDWCKWPAQGHDAGKVAVGSYLEDGHNFIQILESQITPNSPGSYSPSGAKYGLEFNKIAEATHSYPVTRLLWEPPSSQKQSTDLLATSGDHLRLWSLPSEVPVSATGSSISRSANQGRDASSTKLTPLALLSNSKTPEHTAPLTSLDWNTVSPSLIITSSIDTTCTIWDIPTLTAKTQLIAHDKEVFDVRFCANSVDVFVSCGADGSVRMFDLRSLEHSTIIYEPTAKDDKDPNSATGRISPTLAQQTMSYAPPLLRLAASPHDTHLLATFSQDSKLIRILDVRQPGQALLELHGHGAAVNCIEWSPSRRGTLASGADDSTVLIWDLLSQSTAATAPPQSLNGSPMPENSRGPAASWRCDYEVGNISWAPHSALSNDNGDWLGVSGGRGIWGVKL